VVKHRTEVAVGVSVSLLSLVLHAIAHVELQPDWSLYTDHGFGLYPSPVGRALGALRLLEFANAIAAGWVALWLVRSRASKVAVLVSLPVLVWLLPSGVDALGCALAVASVTARTDRRGLLLTLLTLLVHPVAAVVPIVHLAVKRWEWSIPYGAAAVVLALVTPYRAALVPPTTLPALGAALIVLVIGSSVYKGSARELAVVCALAYTVASVRSTDSGMNVAYARYLLPVLVLGLGRDFMPRSGITDAAAGCYRLAGSLAAPAPATLSGSRQLGNRASGLCSRGLARARTGFLRRVLTDAVDVPSDVALTVERVQNVQTGRSTRPARETRDVMWTRRDARLRQ
jgi:hypothetical protein